MFYNLESSEGLPEDRERERIKEVLERAIKQGVRAQLTVKEPIGNFRTSKVFIEELEADVVYVSDSKESAVMPLLLADIRDAELTDQKE